jgi:hypothetical protein
MVKLQPLKMVKLVMMNKYTKTTDGSQVSIVYSFEESASSRLSSPNLVPTFLCVSILSNPFGDKLDAHLSFGNSCFMLPIKPRRNHDSVTLMRENIYQTE